MLTSSGGRRLWSPRHLYRCVRVQASVGPNQCGGDGKVTNTLRHVYTPLGLAARGLGARALFNFIQSESVFFLSSY